MARLATATGLVVAAVLAGCVEIAAVPTVITDLELRTHEEARADARRERERTLRAVRVTTGAGTVVYEDVPETASITGDVTRTPPAGTFDGTLNVTTTWADGTTATQTIAHDPERSVRPTLDRSTRSYFVDEFEPAESFAGGVPFPLRLGGGLSYDGASIPAFGAFTDVTAGESDLLEIDRLQVLRGDLDVRHDVGRYRFAVPGGPGRVSDPSLGAGFSYAAGNGDESREVPARAGRDVAVTYPFPVMGFTGLFYGDTGARAETSLDVSSWQLRGLLRQENIQTGLLPDSVVYDKGYAL